MKKLLGFAAVIGASFVLVGMPSVSAQKKNPLPKAPPPQSSGPNMLEPVYGIGDSMRGLNDALDRLLNPRRRPPQQPAVDTAMPGIQPDPVATSNPKLKQECEAALARLQDSINKYFQAGQQSYQRQIQAISRNKNLKPPVKQGRVLGLRRWWEGVLADQQNINAEIAKKKTACSDTLPHPTNAWSLEEGGRVNAEDGKQLADIVNGLIWNPPPSGAFRPDQLRILIQQPRIIP